MQEQPWEIAAIIGLPNPNRVTFLDLALQCENGLPVKCLYALAQAFAPNEQVFLDFIFSPTTLRRRQQCGKLSAEESDLLIRVADTWLMACDIFGTNEKARRFLFSEHSLLGSRHPFTLTASNAAGAQAVEQVLGRLTYGSAA